MGPKVPGFLWGPSAHRLVSTSCGQSEVKVRVVYHHTNKQVQMLGLMKDEGQKQTGGQAVGPGTGRGHKGPRIQN